MRVNTAGVKLIEKYDDVVVLVVNCSKEKTMLAWREVNERGRGGEEKRYVRGNGNGNGPHRA